MKFTRHAAITAAFAVFGGMSPMAAAGDAATIDWSQVSPVTITLFYPGQSTYEWLRNDHKKGKGAKAVENGSARGACHEGDEKTMGNAIGAGGPLEPTPVKGKNGAVDL